MNATKDAGHALDELGLYQKFVCYRTDGRDQPGRERSEARYFVGDYRYDPHAWIMVASYVTTAGPLHPKLGRDLAAELLSVFPALHADPKARAVFTRVMTQLGLPAGEAFDQSPMYRLMDRYANCPQPVPGDAPNGTQEASPQARQAGEPGTHGGGSE